MAKYMDSGGLSHFMSKVKAAIAATVTGVKGNAESTYRTGQVNLTYANLGTAPIANGGTGATTADAARANLAVVGKADEMLTTNPFAPASLKGPYISKIDNAFYAADKRWNVTGLVDGTTSIAAGQIANLFDGDYESICQLAKDKTCIITLDFSNTTYFPGYPYGYILVSFYYTQAPTSVSGRVYCNYEPHGIGWHDISFLEVSDSSTGSHVYRSAHQGYYNISKLEITVAAGSSTIAGINQIEMHLDRPHSGRNPFLSKYGAETLYYDLTAPKFIGELQGNVTGNATNVTGTVAIANGGTGATSAANARTNLGVPPTSHASSATTYGTGTDANYGHVKLSGSTNSTSGTSGGIAATPSAVKTAYDLANQANGTANTALSGVNGTLIYDHTYTIANGVATFTAHVYCKGVEVTSQYADSAFSWSYRLSDAISETGTPSVVSLGTGKTKTINITTLGLGGHVIGTFTTD